MPLVTLSPADSNSSIAKTVNSNSWNFKDPQSGRIDPRMSPKQVAEVVSDHIISVVRKQFEETKNKFIAKSK